MVHEFLQETHIEIHSGFSFSPCSAAVRAQHMELIKHKQIPSYRGFSMPLHALALEWGGCSDPYKTLAGVVRNTHRSVSAIERATQKTSKNRPNSFLDNVFC